MDAVWWQTQSQDLSETRTSLYMAQHAGWASGPSQFSSAPSSLGPHGRVGWGSGGHCACGFVLCVFVLKIWAWGVYDFQNERALVLGEVLFQSSGLPAVNTTLGNNLGKERRAARASQSWHPVWFLGMLRTHGRLPLPTQRNSRQIVFQAMCVCCNMHKLYTHEFVVSQHYYSLFWANEEFGAVFN